MRRRAIENLKVDDVLGAMLFVTALTGLCFAVFLGLRELVNWVYFIVYLTK